MLRVGDAILEKHEVVCLPIGLSLKPQVHAQGREEATNLDVFPADVPSEAPVYLAGIDQSIEVRQSET